MEINQKTQLQSPGILAVATKKRQIHLYEKIQKGQSLSRPELKELERMEGSPQDLGIVTTQDQVARVFEVTSRTVSRWVTDGMPVRPDGKFSITEIQTWRLLKAKNGANGNQKSFGCGEKEKHEAIFRKYKAKLAEIDYKAAIGDLISKVEVEREMVSKILVVKSALLGIPRRLAPQLVGLEARQIEVILKERMEEIVENFNGVKKIKKSKPE